MFKNILVPIDGSRTSGLGLDEAIKLAKDQEATLFLLHVVDDHALLQSAGAPEGTYIDGLLEALRENGRKIIAEAEAKVRKQDIRSKSLLIENLGSRISDLILNQVRELNADLIVLGTHGRRGVRRLVMGSDAEGVVRETTVPVLLVRSTALPMSETGK